MTKDEAMETIAHAARRFAQEIEDDPDSTENDQIMAREIWEALRVVGV